MKQLVILFLMVTIVSCKKNDVSKSSTTDLAKISFKTPEISAVYHKSDTINIEAQLTAPEKMHGYVMLLTRNEDTIFYQANHTHGTIINVRETWVDTLNAESTLKLQITATLDHDGNTLTETRDFISQP